MQKLNPKKAADNPLAAAILGSVLVKHGRQSGDSAQEKAGLELLRIAEANQDKMPRLKPNSKLAKAIRELKKAMAPRVPEQDSKKVLTGEQPQPKDVRERQTAKP
jgi:hypothetical protein